MYEKLLFVIITLSCAYVLKTVGVFRREHSEPLVSYVLYFSLPALVVQKIREVELGPDSAAVVFIAWVSVGLSMLVSFFVGRFFGFRGRSLRALLLVSSFGNTAFLGYPFTYALFGDEGLSHAVLYDQLGSFLLVVSLGFFVATGRFSLREIAFFPPFIALVVGMFSRSVDIPSGVGVFLEVSGKSLIPVVLFAIGLRLSLSDTFGSLRGSSLALVVKMVLVPLVLAKTLDLLGLDSLPYRVALLETCMPPMVMAGVLAIRYGLDEKLALSSIVLGTVLSFVTVPIIMGLLTANQFSNNT